MIRQTTNGMRLVSLRADGRTHRTWTGVQRTAVPGAFVIPRYAPVYEANGRSWSSRYPVVALFWPKTYFQVFVLLKPNDTDYYANIILPPLDAGDLFFVDLDLDVTVRSGNVMLRDMLEFKNRCPLYQQDWIDKAQQAAQDLMCMANQRAGPFQAATANRWRLVVGQCADYEV